MQHYSSIDYAPYKGVAYYRLKQTDFDGEYSYSNIQSINFEVVNDLAFIIYPIQHFEKQFNLKFNSSKKSAVSITVHTMEGREVFKQDNILVQGEASMELDLYNLKTGVYLITVANNKTIFHNKLFVN